MNEPAAPPPGTPYGLVEVDGKRYVHCEPPCSRLHRCIRDCARPGCGRAETSHLDFAGKCLILGVECPSFVSPD